MPFSFMLEVLPLLLGVVGLIALVRLIYYYFAHVPKKMVQIAEDFKEERKKENMQARYRFTKKRFEKLSACGDWDVVLIGGGIASISCAASLARIGWKCCVLEQGEQIGGGSHIFIEPGGYEFETGVHYIGKDEPMFDLLKFLSCGRLKMSNIGTPVDVHDGCRKVMYDNVVIGENSFPFYEGRKELQYMFHSKFPESGDAIIKFFKHIDIINSLRYKKQQQMFFKLKVPRFLPTQLRSFLQRMICPTVLEYMNKSSEELLRECDIDPKSVLGLALLGQYGDAGVSPDIASSMIQLGITNHYIEGSTYPCGGSGQIPRKLHAVIRAAGGQAFVEANVTDLIYAKDKNGELLRKVAGVVVNGKDEVRAPVVISGISIRETFQKFIHPTFPLLASPRLKMFQIPDEEYFSSAFIFLFIGLDISSQPLEERDSRSHNTWIYPDFCIGKGFPEMERIINSSSPWSVPMPFFVASGSAKDSSFTETFPGKKTIVVLSQCPWSWVKQWSNLTPKQRKKDKDYQNFKKLAEETMMENGFRKVFPKLEKYIKHTSIGTPLSTNNFLATKQGETYGKAATTKHYSSSALSPHTAIGGLFLTGQDICSLGVSGALSSGYITANIAAGYSKWENAFLMKDIMTDLGLKSIVL